MRAVSGVYEVICDATGERYIGGTTNFKRRVYEHKSMLRCGTHHSPGLQAAWEIYGDAGISIRLLLVCDPKNVKLYEQRAMDVLRPKFNIQPRADGPLGSKRSPEQVANWSAKNGAAQRELIASLRQDPEFQAKITEGIRRAFAEGRMKREEKRREYKGRMLTLTEAAEEFGMNRETLRDRLKRGFTFEEALEKPVVRGGPGNRYK